MNLIALAPLWLLGLLIALLVAAAAEDAARFRISNITCGLVLSAAIVAMALAGPTIALWQNLLVFTVILAVGTLLFATGKFGGGDAKLFSAAGLWFDLGGAFTMAISVLIAGGVLTLFVLALRLFGWSEAARRRIHLLTPKAGIPYGIAIASGCLLAISTQRG